VHDPRPELARSQQAASRRRDARGRGGRREDIVGLYHVGDGGSIDLSDSDLPCTFSRTQSDYPGTVVDHIVHGETGEEREAIVVRRDTSDRLVIGLSDDAEITVAAKQAEGE
jgi:hypothetical protein